MGRPGYVVDVNNKSDKSIYVTVPSDACSVNGKMVDFWGGEVVLPGKLAEARSSMPIPMISQALAK